MGKFGGITLIAALGISLAACSAPAATTPAPAETKSVSITQVTPTAAPIKAKAADPSSEVQTVAGEDTELFLRSAKARWQRDFPSDEELLAGGRLACEKMRAGADPLAVVVVTGEAAGSHHNMAVAVAAQDGLCQETIAKR